MKGDGRIFKRGNKFWISYYAPKGGKSVEHRESAGKTQAEARKLLRARLQEIAVHQMGVRTFQGPQANRITVSELLDSLEMDHTVRGLKGVRSLIYHNKTLRNFFAMDRAVGITADRLRSFIAYRQREGVAMGTIKRQMGILRRAFRLAVESGTLAMVPHFPSVVDSPARQGFFSKGEFHAVLSYIDDTDLEDYLQWFYLTGMRPGESTSLTWADLDREEWTIRLPAHNAKTGKGRILALEGELRAIVERRIMARRLDCTLIFHRNGKPIGEFRKRWKTACKAAGVPGKIPYDLRRTAIRDMVRAGVSQNVAMKISGHQTSAVFRRYDIVDTEDLRDAMRKRDEYLSTLPDKQKIKTIEKVRAEKNFP